MGSEKRNHWEDSDQSWGEQTAAIGLLIWHSEVCDLQPKSGSRLADIRDSAFGGVRPVDVCIVSIGVLTLQRETCGATELRGPAFAWLRLGWRVRSETEFQHEESGWGHRGAGFANGGKDWY